MQLTRHWTAGRRRWRKNPQGGGEQQEEESAVLIFSQLYSNKSGNENERKTRKRKNVTGRVTRGGQTERNEVGTISDHDTGSLLGQLELEAPVWSVVG